MTRFYAALIICGLFLSPAASAQQYEAPGELPGLAPLTKRYLHLQEKGGADMLPEGFVYRSGAGGQIMMPVLIRVRDEAAAAAGLAQIGAETGTRAGRIWTVRVPPRRVRDLAGLGGIDYVQLDEPVYPYMDTVIRMTRADSVHQGIGLELPYTGKGVIMGVIDFGFDYNHPLFYDGEGTGYRISRVWELDTTGTPPAPFTYGHEFTSRQDLEARGTDNPHQTHGTAVAGVAAGSGFGSLPEGANSLRGIAYESEMVLVGVRRGAIGRQWLQGSFVDFLDAINYIFSYAESAGKPAVINISWGSQSGPHNGTTLFNEACNNLSGPGRILVMSAGNDGGDNIHLYKEFSGTDTVVNTFLQFNPGHYKRTWVDIWGQKERSFCTKVTFFQQGASGPATEWVCTADALRDTFLVGSDGDTCYVEFITSAAEYNGDPRVTIDVYNKSADSVFVSVRATEGAVHAWNEYYYYGYEHRYKSTFTSASRSWAVNGNTNSTVSDMGSAHSVLLVGAYNSKPGFPNILGGTTAFPFNFPKDRISSYSSRGPMTDGRIKPDITAPGTFLITGVSSYDTSHTETGSNRNMVASVYNDAAKGRDFYYAAFLGTSAAGPVASGVVALMLQANPELRPWDVQDIIKRTALKQGTNLSSSTPENNTWGAGKINAYDAVKGAIRRLDVYSFTGETPDFVLFPNPNQGAFTMEYVADREETLHLTVQSLAGQLVAARSWKVSPGINREPVEVAGAAPGIYVISVMTKTGSAHVRVRIDSPRN